MGSSEIISIFHEPQRASLYPSPFVVSILLHASVFSLLTIRMIEKNRIIERFPTDNYSLRLLDFHSTPPPSRAAGGISYRGPLASPKPNPTQASALAAKGSGASGSPTMTQETAQQRMPAPQTLIQPDLPRDELKRLKTPVPLVVLWSPDKVVAKKVVPPMPDRAAIAVVQPSLDMPIPEENLAEFRISSTPIATATPAAPPSTTSPVVVHGPEEVKKVPQTTSKQPEPPTPNRVVSLSDIRVADGKVVLPMVNETSPKVSAGAMIPGQLKPQPQAGAGASPAKTQETGAGKAARDHAAGRQDNAANAGKGTDPHGKAEVAGNSAKAGIGPSVAGHGDKPGPAASVSVQPAAALNGGQGGAGASPNQGAGTGTTAGNGLSTVHISLPKDGQFGVVVVGSSIADKYPETAELWSGRMGATVYLRVGLPKSWILQYTLPRLAEAAQAGGKLEAPWPYEIVRPNIDPGDVDSDAIILHGFINKDGRFEKLEVVFPTQLVQAPMVLNVLNQWQFRPAKQSGVFAAVEVLLIIPDQSQ